MESQPAAVEAIRAGLPPGPAGWERWSVHASAGDARTAPAKKATYPPDKSLARRSKARGQLPARHWVPALCCGSFPPALGRTPSHELQDGGRIFRAKRRQVRTRARLLGASRRLQWAGWFRLALLTAATAVRLMMTRRRRRDVCARRNAHCRSGAHVCTGLTAVELVPLQ